MSGQSLRNEGSVRESPQIAATWDLALARHVIGHAARKAPPGLAARLEEEWLADLMARPSGFSRIRFAVGCCWATRIIAREFGTAAATAGSSAAGARLLVGYGGPDFSRVSRRTIALIAIVCLHVGAFYLYLTGFTGMVTVHPDTPLSGGVIIKTRSMPQQPTPLQPPKLSPTTVQAVPTPRLKFDFPPQTKAITVAHLPPDFGSVRLQASHPVTRMLGGPGAGFPDTEDYYPADARRLDEAGATVVGVCVDPRGRLTAAPTVVKSSGIGLIDEGALKLAGAGSGHYRPTTENGRPVSACYAFRISFQLRDQL